MTDHHSVLQRIRDFLSDPASPPLLSVYHQPDYRQQPDREIMVHRACEIIRQDMQACNNTILPCFFPDFGTVSTAGIYGGERMMASDGGAIHIKSLVRSIAGLEQLKPCPFEESDFQSAIDLFREVCERLGTDDIYLRTPDFQGPLNTLALVMDQTEMMIGMMEDPDAIKNVLERITTTLIAYVTRFRASIGAHRVIGSIWPYTALPDGHGVSITQDYMPLLSPSQYEAFELPQLQRISTAFGGVHIHCCGDYTRHLAALKRSKMKIWGLESHYPGTTVEDIFAVFGNTVPITPFVAPHGQAQFPTLASLIRSWKGTPHAKGRYWFCFCHEWGDIDELRSAIEAVFQP